MFILDRLFQIFSFRDTSGCSFVSGEGDFEIPFRCRPFDVSCDFDLQCDIFHPTCGGGDCPDDTCNIEIIARGPLWRRRWFVKVSWKVGESRTRKLVWMVQY